MTDLPEQPTDTNGFDIVALVDEITAITQDASRLSLNWFRQPMQIDNKADDNATTNRFDPVTADDRAVEEALRRALSQRFPGHQIYGEEFGSTGDGPYRWVIDPIDGTRAFITGQPLWGTLLGLQHYDEVIAGWLHQPALNHTYVASPAGAFLYEADAEAAPLATSTVTDLADAVLLTTHPDQFSPGLNQNRWQEISSLARLTRYGGDCINYAYLATGFADLVIETGLMPYDIMALIPIVTQAGGIITDLEGKPPVEGGWVIAAATRQLHQQALEMLNDLDA